jgi:hypothetical protein
MPSFLKSVSKHGKWMAKSEPLPAVPLNIGGGNETTICEIN